MLDSIMTDLPTHGAWGLLTAVLLAANIAQWKRADKRDDSLFRVLDEYRELATQTAAALVEQNMLARHDRR